MEELFSGKKKGGNDWVLGRHQRLSEPVVTARICECLREPIEMCRGTQIIMKDRCSIPTFTTKPQKTCFNGKKGGSIGLGSKKEEERGDYGVEVWGVAGTRSGRKLKGAERIDSLIF